MPNKLLFITLCLSALYAWFYMYNNYGKPKAYIEFDDDDRQEVIVVNKVPRGTFWGEDWYDIGLSRNGEEPIEYIWRAGQEPYNYFIMLAEIGDRGTIHLDELAKRRKEKLPRPNAENSPIIGVLGEVYWEKYNDDNDRQEVIVVSKTESTPYGKAIPRSGFFGTGGYVLGLSRNGEDPVEYLWYAGYAQYGDAVRNTEIGDKGIVGLQWWAKKYYYMRLPQPNAENPPIIGFLGEVYWKKQE